MTSSTHRWRFFRAGGFDQVRLDTGADLAHLAGLDQKLWVALSCPTQGVELDAATLALVDTDTDGHVRQGQRQSPEGRQRQEARKAVTRQGESRRQRHGHGNGG